MGRFAVVFAAIAVSLSAATYYFLKRYSARRRRELRQLLGLLGEDHWHHVGKLREINFFPVKSCAGLQLNSVSCQFMGLNSLQYRDRGLILLTDDNRVAFAGAHPRMLSINSDVLRGPIIRVTAPKIDPMDIHLEHIVGMGRREFRNVQGYVKEVIEGQPEHHKWFSRVILQRDTGMRLFLEVKPGIRKDWLGNFESDLKPVMLLNKKSLDHLNSKLSAEDWVDHRQFRDNLLIQCKDKIPAFDEDRWMWVMIGCYPNRSIMLCHNSPCVRCILPNINIRTCERNPHNEPLKTLMTYRCRNRRREPEMGIYYDVHKTGRIKVGDDVYVQYRVE